MVSTSDFGSDSLGSSPSISTQFEVKRREV